MSVKSVISIGVLVLSAAAARGDLLFWMVDADVYRDNYSFVSLNAETSGGQTELLDLAQLQPGGVPYLIETPVGGFASDNYSFFIEMFADDQSPAGRSDAVPYAALKAYIGSTSAEKPKAYFSGWTFSSVPEPTSGLLLPVGAALLGLRRKRTI